MKASMYEKTFCTNNLRDYCDPEITELIVVRFILERENRYFHSRVIIRTLCRRHIMINIDFRCVAEQYFPSIFTLCLFNTAEIFVFTFNSYQCYPDRINKVLTMQVRYIQGGSKSMFNYLCTTSIHVSIHIHPT